MAINVHNQFGGICNAGWDAKSADVVCRQMGYPGVAKINGVVHNYTINNKILADKASCNDVIMQDCQCLNDYKVMMQMFLRF